MCFLLNQFSYHIYLWNGLDVGSHFKQRFSLSSCQVKCNSLSFKIIQSPCFNKRRHQNFLDEGGNTDSYQAVRRLLVCLITWKWRLLGEKKRNAPGENFPSSHKLQHLCTHREKRRLLTDGFHASGRENIYCCRKWRSGSRLKRKREMVQRSLSTLVLRYLKPFTGNVRGTRKEKKW